MKNNTSHPQILSPKTSARTPVFALAASLLLLAGALSLRAQVDSRTGSGALNLATSWSTGAAPTSSGIGAFDGMTPAGDATITSLGATAVGIGQIMVSNNAPGAVSIADTATADTLTLSGVSLGGTPVGIDMSVANYNLSLGSQLTIGASQTWNIGPGRTLTFNGVTTAPASYTFFPNFNGQTVTINGPGIVAWTAQTTTGAKQNFLGGLVFSNTAFNITLLSAGYTSGWSNTWFNTPNISLSFSGTNIFSIISPSGNPAIFRQTQPFTNVTFNPGSTAFIFNMNGDTVGNCAMQGSLSNVTRYAGSMADFTAATTSGSSFQVSGSAGNFDSWFLPGSTVLGYATWATNDWLRADGWSKSPYIATYANDTYTTATNDIAVVAGTAPPSGFTINSWHFNTAIAPTLALGGANIITSGGILVGQTVAANNTTINGPGTLTSGNTTANGVSDLIVINNNDLAAGTGNFIINAPIVNNGSTPVGLTVGSTDMAHTAPGSVVLGGINTFTGPTFITKGTLQLNAQYALQNSTFSNILSGTLTFGAASTSYTLGGLAGPDNLVLDNATPAGVALSVGNNNSSTVYSGILSDGGYGGSLIKVGTGYLVLNGVNTYTGSTTINGGTLGGGGTIAGSVSVNSGGQTYPGVVTPGTTNTIVGGLTCNAGSSNSFALNTSAASGATGNDQIILSGPGSVLSPGGAVVYINAYGGALDSVNKYVLFNVSGGGTISGSFNPIPQWIGTPPTGYLGYSIAQIGNTVVLQLGSLGNAPVITAATVNGGNPGAVLQNETVPVVVTANQGTDTHPIASVSVLLSPLGGTNVGTTLTLVSDGAGHYTNNLVLGLGVPVGPYSLFAAVTDNATPTPNAAYTNLEVTVGSAFTPAGNPNPAVANQPVTISATVSPNATNVPITALSVNLAPIGGVSSVPLTYDPTLADATFGQYTNTVTLAPSLPPGPYSLVFTATAGANSATDALSLTLAPESGTAETWNGGDYVNSPSWADNGNWASGLAPGFGDNIYFGGATGLAPVMTNSYSLAGVTFNGAAGSFTITNSGSATLTLTGSVTNNASTPQALNAPIALNAATVMLNDALVGGLTLDGVISGAASYGLEPTNGNVTLGGSNTFAGPVTIGSGTLTIGASGSLGGATGINYTGAITNNGTLLNDSTVAQTWSGLIAGTGGLTMNAGTLTLGNDVLAGESYTGPTVVNGGTLNLNFPNPGTGGLFTSSSLTINSGGTVQLLNDNGVSGSSSAIGTSVPVTVNAGGVLTSSPTGDGGTGCACHLRSLLTINGGTLACGGTGILPAYGTFNFEDGVVVNGGVITSTLSAPDMIPDQAGGTIFNITSGGTPSGIDLNVTGSLINGTSLPDTGIILQGTGAMALSGVNTYAGNTTIGSGNTLDINGAGVLGNGNYAGNITNNGGTLNYNSTANQVLSGAISGSGGSLYLNSPATLTTTGVNTYTGVTGVNGGKLIVAANGSSVGNLSVSNGAILQVNVNSAGGQWTCLGLTFK
ncbi:MAG: autotransporter-associated beta strand repeat-containing protein, partial [Verrucomicrobiota bacterium]